MILLMAFAGCCLSILPISMPNATEGLSCQSDPMVGYWTDGEVLLRVWKDENSYLARIERCARGAEYAEKMYSWRIGEAAFEVVYAGRQDGARIYRGLTREWNPIEQSHELRTGFEISLHSEGSVLELAITRGGDTIYFRQAKEVDR